MDNTLGRHLLIDLYNCNGDINSVEYIHSAVSDAFEFIDTPMDDISYHQSEEELIVVAVAVNTHICVHSYPFFAYVAIDIYSFNSDLNLSSTMKVLKAYFQSDRVKATSVRRGDFGSLRDMRPKSKTSITTIRRMKNTGARIKNTGAQIRRTSAKMFRILRNQDKDL